MKTVNDLVVQAKRCVWLNPGIYLIENPLSPQNLENDLLKMYMYGATLVIQSDYMFDTASSLMLMGGKIVVNSSKLNRQQSEVYMQGVTIGSKADQFLGNITVKPVPAYF